VNGVLRRVHWLETPSSGQSDHSWGPSLLEVDGVEKVTMADQGDAAEIEIQRYQGQANKKARRKADQDRRREEEAAAAHQAAFAAAPAEEAARERSERHQMRIAAVHEPTKRR